MNRWLVSVAAYFCAIFVLLAFTHSLLPELKYQRFSTGHWLGVFLGMTAMLTILGAILAPAAAKLVLPERRYIASGILVAIATTVVAFAYSHWVATLTAQQSDRIWLAHFNHFFRELNSIMFSFVVAPIAGLLAGGLHGFRLARSRHL